MIWISIKCFMMNFLYKAYLFSKMFPKGPNAEGRWEGIWANLWHEGTQCWRTLRIHLSILGTQYWRTWRRYLGSSTQFLCAHSEDWRCCVEITLHQLRFRCWVCRDYSAQLRMFSTLSSVELCFTSTKENVLKSIVFSWFSEMKRIWVDNAIWAWCLCYSLCSL